MKVAFSTTSEALAAPMDPRFGRAAFFLLYDTETKAIEVLKNAFADAGQGAGLKAAETIVKAGATSVVTGVCGPKAAQALRQAGVRIYSARDVSVADALAAFEAKTLPEIASA